MKSILKHTITLLLLLGFTQVTQAASGDLDTSFGTNGIVTTTYADFFPDVDAVNSAGKSVIYLDNGQIIAGGSVNTVTLSPASIASYFSLTRYNEDGSLDSTFGNNGRVITDFSSNFPSGIEQYLIANSGTIQRPDGNFVSAGLALIDEGAEFFYDYVVAVYNPDGSLDTSFNPSGPLPGTLYFRFNLTPNFPLGGATSVTAQTDNKILLSGIGGDGTLLYDFVTIRLNTDGSFDSSFNSTGPVPGASVINFGSGNTADVSLSILFNPNNGQIITGGTTLVSIPTSLDLALAGYDSNGALLSSFGTAGLQVINLGGGTSASQVNAMALQSNSLTVSAGSHNNGFSVERYLSDGSLDPSFGNGTGFFATDLLVGVNFVQDSGDMSVAVDDKLFVTGSNNDDFAFIKLLSDGSSLDTNFNSASADPGFVQVDIGTSSTDRSYGIDLQSDGKILVIGTSNSTGPDQLTLARFLGNTSDLSITKTADNSFSTIGSNITFTITVSNSGPDTAEGTVVTDSLPEGLSLVSATASQGSCTGTSTVTCNLGDVTTDASAVVTLVALVSEANIFENTATVTAQVVDTNSANNSATITVLALLTQGGGCSLNADNSASAGMLLALLALPFFTFAVLRRFRFLP